MRTAATIAVLLLALIARADEASDRDAHVRTSPKLMRLALSAQVCAYTEWRTRTLAEITKQKHYSSVGGAVDLRVMYTLQRRLRALDEFIAADRTELKHIRQKSYACGSDEMNAVFMCENGTEPDCKQEPWPTIIAILDEHDDEIPGAELFSENYE